MAELKPVLPASAKTKDRKTLTIHGGCDEVARVVVISTIIDVLHLFSIS